jgi:hypothetical protein
MHWNPLIFHIIDLQDHIFNLGVPNDKGSLFPNIINTHRIEIPTHAQGWLTTPLEPIIISMDQPL